MNTKNIKGFRLILEYPNSPKLGTFEPYTTGEFLKYPEIWKPVYNNERIVTTTTTTIVEVVK